MSIRTGDLNRRITLQARNTALDTWGQQTTTWTDLLTCWASIAPLSGRELELAKAINAAISHEITILYRPGVTASHRAVYQGRVLNIEAVLDPNMAHEVLQLMCSEGLNPG